MTLGAAFPSSRAAPRRVRHIVFDLDGTLVDSRLQIVAILNEMLAERGCPTPIDLEAARPHMSAGGLHLVSTLLGSWCGDPEHELEEFRCRYRQAGTSPEALFSGVSEGLERLRAAGLSLGVCSNKPQNLCEKVLADTDLAQHFDVVIGETDGLRPKPEPDLLDAVLEALGALPEQCLYVGDSELDHQVAAARGIPFLFMTYGYANKDWTPEGCDTFDKFEDMSAAAIALQSRPGLRLSNA